ncbi:capsular polysaccharide export protein [Sphingomonas sp. YR710]|uniref:capsular polysaccharide export protein, LipB/KpsS family n=1 Tax=Sphingomonas sp. YR710 TaxID=1882773 RepID=UPI00088F76C7|nr:capsule biosynthesis protein [Sphingomonas sp. YR710]SDC75462.1 capsular polysaccharide export protein [Sphingomonas sp. YR710]
MNARRSGTLVTQEPFLRSPPFPGTATAIAAVSSPRARPGKRKALIDAERDRALRVADLIVAERVGGRFWGSQQPSEESCDPWSRTDSLSSVCVDGNDELGFVAWLRGIDVKWLNAGTYADHHRDDGHDSLARAITALLIDGVTYRDPYSGNAITIEEAIAQLAFWRRTIDRNRGLAAATGIAGWKQREVEAMLWPGSEGLHFTRSAGVAVRYAAARNGAVAVWPTRAPKGLDALAEADGVAVHPVEDGFLRSSGLGSDCHPPHSIILDRSGLHFDPRQPSDLELMIAAPIDDPALLARADRLARTIVETGVSKYSSSRAPFARPETDRKVVLVTGQVEDDLSVRLGAAGVRGNLDLIIRARKAEPDAFLIFRPHPDVDAGHRRGRIEDWDALRHVDMVERGASIASILEVVDSVHVLTSLTGFEALLRDCEVVTHGYPFYAGWGLTRDLAPPIDRRRARAVSRAQLVAAALILYPRYLDPVTKLPCPPEVLIERLAAQPVPQETLLTRLRKVQGRIRRGLAGARTPA